MHIKNYMEEVVWESLDRVLDTKEGVCKCDKCRNDIVAIALNALPPRYVVTDLGETYTRIKALEQQFYADVITAITNAAVVVQASPRHDKLF